MAALSCDHFGTRALESGSTEPHRLRNGKVSAPLALIRDEVEFVEL